MRILGIDPSLHSTGYGMIDTSGRTLRLVEGGVLAPGKSADLPERLAELQRGLLDVIRTLRPDAMVVEEIFSRPAFPRTALLMAHARGVLCLAGAQAGIAVHTLGHAHVKRALSGSTDAPYLRAFGDGVVEIAQRALNVSEHGL